MLRTAFTTLSALAVLTGAAAAAADAAPLPGVPADQQIGARLALVGVAPQGNPTVDADQVCNILRTTPDAEGKSEALGVLTERGYADAFQRGWALGTYVDATCPEMVEVIQ